MQKNRQEQVIAEIKNDLAFAYYCAGDYPGAEMLYRDSAGRNSGSLVAFPKDLAKSLMMLGRIEEHRANHTEALRNYQDAIKALHMYKTLVYKFEQAEVMNRMGWLQLNRRNLEETNQVYREAIRLFQETGTQTHPSCADAYIGLASLATFKGELTSATVHATQAQKILDVSVVPTHPRQSCVHLALAAIHELSGNPEQAAVHFERIDTIMQNPLGPWREDFLNASAFYGELLNKSGKGDAATHLKQIESHQKSRSGLSD